MPCALGVCQTDGVYAIPSSYLVPDVSRSTYHLKGEIAIVHVVVVGKVCYQLLIFALFIKKEN